MEVELKMLKLGDRFKHAGDDYILCDNRYIREQPWLYHGFRIKDSLVKGLGGDLIVTVKGIMFSELNIGNRFKFYKSGGEYTRCTGNYYRKDDTVFINPDDCEVYRIAS